MKEIIGIFERYSVRSEPGPFRTALRRLRTRRRTFSTAFVVSLVIHAALGIALILVPANIGEKDPANVQALLRRAVEDIVGENPDDPEMAAFLAEAARSGLLNDLGKIQIAGTGLADGMKIEILKAILKASLAAQGKSLTDLLREKPTLVLPDGSKAFTSAVEGEPASSTISVLPRKDLAALQETARLAELRKTDKGFLADKKLVRVQTPKGNAVVPADYFFRKCAYEKILSWGADLFFFSTGFPLDLRGSTEAASDAASPVEPGMNSETGVLSGTSANSGLIRVFLVRPSTLSRAAVQSGDAAGAASVANDEAEPRARDCGAILDKLMPLAENEQLTAFIRDYLEKADPDAPETAALADAFFQNNLNIVIFDITDFAAGFDCLEELYFNKVLALRIADLYDRLRETRTGTECLLYFASQYDFERRALERLLAAQAEADAFLSGRSRTAELFEKERKCQIVRDIGRKVLSEMNKRGYAKPADVLSVYRREQERIYEYLIGRGGEDRDRGLFALGRYYWDLGRSDLAFNAWADIRPSFMNGTFKKIRNFLEDRDDPRVKLVKIRNVLERNELQGMDEFLSRLVKFGKWRTRGG